MTDDTGRHQLEGSELKRSVVHGVRWTVASQGATQVLGLITSVIVARLLGPRDVGLAAEALVFGSLALVLVQFGFGSALIRRPVLSEEEKSTAFWASVALGLAVTLFGVGLSGPIASLYGEPRVQPLFAVLSLAFVITSLSIVQGAILARELRFRSLQVRTIIATTASCATAIALAILGVGPWAIVAQDLVIASVSTALLWRASSWRPRASFSVDSLRSMAGYASQVFGASTLSWGTLNLDNFLIGRYLGPAPLATYAIAFSVIITPVNRIARPIFQVFFPAFSRLREPPRIAGAWTRGVRMVALVVVPLMLGVIPVGPDLVNTLFGARWEAAIPVIQILAPVGLIQALVVLNEGVLEALGNARTLFRFTAVLSIATVGAFVAGLQWGIEGVAVAYLAVTVVLQPVFVWLTTRVVGLAPIEWLRSVAGVLQAGILMMVVVFGARALLLDTGLPVGVRLLVLIAIGALAYVPLVVWRAPEARAELRGLRLRRRLVSDVPNAESTEVPV